MHPDATHAEGPVVNAMSIDVEDYFQVGAFNQLIQRGQWYRFETRLEKNTDRALEMLARYDIKATFFVLGWVADLAEPDAQRMPTSREREAVIENVTLPRLPVASGEDALPLVLSWHATDPAPS